MKDEIISEMRQKMKTTVASLDREFKKMRTGRASTSILEGIKVECYGTQMRLNQIASLSSPESRLLTIQPWDQSIIGDIEKSILKSGLGLTPMNDGKLIRISIPPLTEERRKGLLNQAYVRDTDMSIQDLLNEVKAKTGENIVIKRFVRFQLGEVEAK